MVGLPGPHRGSKFEVAFLGVLYRGTFRLPWVSTCLRAHRTPQMAPPRIPPRRIMVTRTERTWQTSVCPGSHASSPWGAQPAWRGIKLKRTGSRLWGPGFLLHRHRHGHIRNRGRTGRLGYGGGPGRQWRRSFHGPSRWFRGPLGCCGGAGVFTGPGRSGLTTRPGRRGRAGSSGRGGGESPGTGRSSRSGDKRVARPP